MKNSKYALFTIAGLIFAAILLLALSGENLTGHFIFAEDTRESIEETIQEFDELTEATQNKLSKNAVSLSPKEAFEVISKKDPIIVDVRTREEYLNNGMRDAINIDSGSAHVIENLRMLNRDDTYILYCRINTRSNNMMEIMEEMGFSSIYIIKGGITAWNRKGFP